MGLERVEEAERKGLGFIAYWAMEWGLLFMERASQGVSGKVCGGAPGQFHNREENSHNLNSLTGGYTGDYTGRLQGLLTV